MKDETGLRDLSAGVESGPGDDDELDTPDDLREDVEAHPDEGEEPGVCPDLRGDVAEDPDEPVAGDELDADEDLLVDVTSEGLCVYQELSASSQ